MGATQRLLTGRSAEFADNGGGGGGGSGDNTTYIEQVETGGEFDTTSAVFVPVTGTDVDFTLTEAKKVRIWYEFTAIHLIADTDLSAFYGIDIDGTTYKKGEFKISVAAGGSARMVIHIEKMISLAAGSYTATLMLKSDGAHNARIESGADAPTYSSISYVSGSGGGDMTDSMLLKSFFTAQGLLPASTFLEELYTYPDPPIKNLAGGTLARSMSRAKFSPAGVGPVNWGWDLGSSKGEILIVSGMNRLSPAPVGNVSLFVTDTLPAAAELSNGSYIAFASAGGEYAIYKRAAGTYALVASSAPEAIIIPPVGADTESFAFALYYKASTNRLIIFVRHGSECWIPAVDTTDATFGTMRYVGVRPNWASGTPPQWSGTPLAIYSD